MDRSDCYVPVVIAFTPNYFIPAATTLYSLFHAAEKECFHVICLLSVNLPDEQKKKIQQIGGVQARYSFIDLSDRLQNVSVDSKYTVATLYRLLIPDLLTEYDKVLYMDCDVIVRNNLGELFRTVDLGDNYLAGVFEAPVDFQIEHLKKIGCDPYSYINAGIIIMNLAMLRADNMTKKFIELLSHNQYEFPDQDVLNLLCYGKIVPLKPYYNSIRTFYLPQYKFFFLKQYTEDDWVKVWQCGNIHYTGDKPWRRFTVQFSVWWRYYEKLPANIRNESIVSKRMFVLYQFYKSFLGLFLIDGIQSLYRKLKY